MQLGLPQIVGELEALRAQSQRCRDPPVAAPDDDSSRCHGRSAQLGEQPLSLFLQRTTTAKIQLAG